VRLLLDTHVVLWWLEDSPVLGEEVKSMIDDLPQVFTSPVTVWEATIKRMAGKLNAPPDLARLILDGGLQALPITFEHAEVAGALPLLHRDPFDRMLIAQAKCEGLTLVTRDAAIAQYEVEVLAV
jgi:PIN domain nuclease of toxin-antitoxin system